MSTAVAPALEEETTTPPEPEQFEMYVAEVDVIDHPQAPVNGRGIYIIVEETGARVTLCYPWTLDVFSVPLQSFIRNVGLTYWPLHKRDAPSHLKFDGEKMMRGMEEKLQDFAQRQKQHPAQTIRRILAHMRGIPLEQVPQYKEPKVVKEGVTRERGQRKPGVIDAIKELLEDGYTVDEFVGKLAERFPEREADGMRNTVKCQLARLPKNTNRPITKTDAGGGRIVFKWGV